MPRDKTMVRRQVYLTAREVKLLNALSKQSGLTVSDLIRRAIDKSLQISAQKA